MDRRVRAGLLALASVAMIVGFKNLLLDHAPTVFAGTMEDMSYGWFVPVFSLYVLWRERRETLAVLGAPSVWGLLATLPFIVCGFLGVRGVQMRFEVLAFAGLCVTIPWALFGGATAKRVLFPACFLLFCIPLTTFLDIITVHLRLFATSMAYWMMAGFGADVVRRGTAILAGDGSFSVDVASPCSGLRSIFALMALTAGYAYFTQKTWLKRGILFALSVPLAILGNVMRILTICIVAKVANPTFALGFYHDYSGYVVFLVAIALMVACGRVIERIPIPGRRSQAGGGSCGGGSSGTALPGAAVVLCEMVLVVWSMAALALTPKVTLAEAPNVVLNEVEGYASEAFEPSEGELTTLPADTRFIKRLYTAPDGHWFRVSAVIGGSSKSSIHRPELCLPAQGRLMTNPRTVHVGGRDWHLITLEGGPNRPQVGFAYTFFNQEGYRTSSHVKRIFRDVCDRSFLNRIDRWVMITVSASRGDDESIAAFLAKIEGGLK